MSSAKYECETDLDLPPIRRTQANYYQARFLEYYKAIVEANKGIRRLVQKVQWYKKKNDELRQIIADNGLSVPNEQPRKEAVVMAG